MWWLIGIGVYCILAWSIVVILGFLYPPTNDEEDMKAFGTVLLYAPIIPLLCLGSLPYLIGRLFHNFNKDK